MKVYDTASAISQIDCNEWVKLQDVEAIISKVRLEYVNPKCAWGLAECVLDCPSCARMDAMLVERAAGDKEGQREMLEKCLKIIEHLHDYETSQESQKDALWKALTALR
jgi:hypothetical protein